MIAPMVVVMGPSGSGKTTVGRALALRLGLPFIEGDDLHPPANRAKMQSGHPLTDADRWPWLDAVASQLAASARASGGAVASCSALKRAYRDRISQGAQGAVLLICLTVDRATLAGRISGRQGHYMPETLLDSQLLALEPPQPDEAALVLRSDTPVDTLVEEILASWGDRLVRSGG